MERKTVGRFSFNLDGTIDGPADYMKAEGIARIRRIEQGGSEADRRIIANAPDFITGILICLQTDYAAWAGYTATFGRAPRG